MEGRTCPPGSVKLAVSPLVYWHLVLPSNKPVSTLLMTPGKQLCVQTVRRQERQGQLHPGISVTSLEAASGTGHHASSCSSWSLSSYR